MQADMQKICFVLVAAQSEGVKVYPTKRTCRKVQSQWCAAINKSPGSVVADEDDRLAPSLLLHLPSTVSAWCERANDNTLHEEIA